MTNMKIELLGTSFNIETNAEPEYLNEVLDFYNIKIEEVKNSVNTSDPIKIAILAGILVVDEYFKETQILKSKIKKEHNNEDEHKVDNMIETLDKLLDIDDN